MSVSDSPRVTVGSSFGSHGVGDPVGASVVGNGVGDNDGLEVDGDTVGVIVGIDVEGEGGIAGDIVVTNGV